MNIDIFYKSYWKYFLDLEEDLIRIQRYVNFEKNNWNVYSNEFIKLLDVVCSEIDVIAKEYILYNIPKLKDVDRIAKWGYYIQQLVPDINTLKLKFNNEEIITPWKNWQNETYVDKKGRKSYRLKKGKKNPIWWTAYNSIKHQRTSMKDGRYNYEKANLENLINAFGGLYLIETSFMENLEKQDGIAIIEQSKLFRIIG